MTTFVERFASREAAELFNRDFIGGVGEIVELVARAHAPGEPDRMFQVEWTSDATIFPSPNLGAR